MPWDYDPSVGINDHVNFDPGDDPEMDRDYIDDDETDIEHERQVVATTAAEKNRDDLLDAVEDILQLAAVDPTPQAHYKAAWNLTMYIAKSARVPNGRLKQLARRIVG